MRDLGRHVRSAAGRLDDPSLGEMIEREGERPIVDLDEGGA